MTPIFLLALAGTLTSEILLLGLLSASVAAMLAGAPRRVTPRGFVPIFVRVRRPDARPRDEDRS